jgi:phage tail sheath protein FI
MGNQLLASKIIVEEESPAPRGIPVLDTAIAGFVGITEKGPVGTATLVNSVTEYSRVFGGWTADSAEMVAAVQGFFENGGSQLYVVRATVYSGGASTADTAKVTLVNASSANTLDVFAKYPGTYAHAYTIKVSAATSGVSSEFNLEVKSGAVVLETFPNVTMDTTAARYVVTIVNDANNGSTRIFADDLDLSGSVTTRRPANATSSALAGGSDALPSADVDYYGTQADGNGLYAFDTIDDLTILAVPGFTTAGVQAAMVTYTETYRNGQVFCIFDPPAATSHTNMVGTFLPSLTTTEYGALYWPQVKVSNPSKAVFGNVDTITVPPSGHVAGVYARTDNARVGGVWDPPAGTENGKLLGVLGFETDTVLKEAVRDYVFPKRINPLTTMKGFPRFVDGARCLKGDGNFPTVAQRRGVSFVERSVKLGLQFARHQNNNASLRTQLYSTVYAFLKTQTDLGAFASKDPTKAFFVDFGDALNPATSPNVVTGRIGLATVQPAEFIRLLFSQDTRAIDAELAA